MPKRSSKDLNQIAFNVVVQQATGQADKPEKNPAAVALGLLRGLKSGKASSEALSLLMRKEIARKAAVIRWNKKPNKK